MDIGSLVATVRAKAGLTQQQLADRAHTSQSAVARMERGRGSPSVETLQRLIEAAGFTLTLDVAPAAARHAPRDAVVEAYKKDVDRSLLRENLAKTVDQRLRDMESFRRSAEELRRGVRRAKRAR
jgi:transcriptional regulator with XRE-family HTH domain